MYTDSTAALQLLALHAQSDKVTYECLGPTLTERLSLSILDLLGCHIASVRMGANAAIARAITPSHAHERSAAIWAGDRRAAAADAALVNGTIAHHAEFDGGWHGPPRVGVHPAISVLPAAIAVAESCDATGREFVGAAAAGYDVLAAIAQSLSPYAVAHRLHPPGLLGSFGAAAAASRLLRHDAQATARALAVCGGMSPLCPFESFTAGASAKDLYGGWSAAVGVLAATRAATTAHDFTLPELLGRAPLCPSEMKSVLESSSLIGADFKAYPTCRTVHPALTALEALLEHHPVVADDVEAIDVETYAYAVELDGASDTLQPIGARTSVLMCLALRLRFGSLQPHHFTPANLCSPTLRELCARSHISVGRYASRAVRGATVSLRLRNGDSLTFSVDTEKWSSAQPATAAQIIDKFHQQAAESLDDKDRDELLNRVMSVHREPSMRFVSTILARSEHRIEAVVETRGYGQPTTGLELHLRETRLELLSGLAKQGMNSALLTQTFDSVDCACIALDPKTTARAFTLSLALVPASAGPVPVGWSRTFAQYIRMLAGSGFSGPEHVMVGARGLCHLATASIRQ